MKLIKDNEDLLLKIAHLSTMIANVDLQSTKWHTEMLSLLDSVADSLRQQHESIMNILDILMIHERAIMHLSDLQLKTVTRHDALTLPSHLNTDKKPN